MSRSILFPLAALALAACGDATGLTTADLDGAIAAHDTDPAAHPGVVDATRLPDEVVLADELDDAISDIDPTTDASDLTSGTLDPARLPSEVVLDSELTTAARGGTAGVQVTSFTGSVQISTTSVVELLSLDVTTATATDVVIVSHAYLERSAATTGRYDLSLRLGTCAGDTLGATFWRPSTSDDSFAADVVTFTGYAPGIDGAATIKLCGSKFDSGAPTATAGFRGMIAHW